MLDILSDTIIAKNLHLPGLEKHILVTKLKIFLFRTSTVEGPILSF